MLIAACGLTFVVNPYGLRLPQVWLEIMRSPVVARLIEEHAPLDARSPDGLLILFFALVYLGILASVRPWRPRVTWLLPLFWLYETVTRVRHSPLFSITAALAMAEMLPHTRLAALLARPGRDLFQFRAADQQAKRAARLEGRNPPPRRHLSGLGTSGGRRPGTNPGSRLGEARSQRTGRSISCPSFVKSSESIPREPESSTTFSMAGS